MSRRSVFTRLLVLGILPGFLGALSTVVVGSILFGVVVTTFLIGAQLLVAIWQESSILLRLNTVTDLDATMGAQLRTLEHLLARKLKPGRADQFSGQPPALYVLNDSQMGIWVIRSFGSSGAIILSRGLFALWGDPQWDQALDRAITRLRAPGIVLATYSAWMQGVFGFEEGIGFQRAALGFSGTQGWFGSFVELWKAPLQALLSWVSGNERLTQVLIG